MSGQGRGPGLAKGYDVSQWGSWSSRTLLLRQVIDEEGLESRVKTIQGAFERFNQLCW